MSAAVGRAKVVRHCKWDTMRLPLTDCAAWFHAAGVRRCAFGVELERRRDYLIPTTIESGPTRCSTRVSLNPISFIQPMQSAPV